MTNWRQVLDAAVDAEMGESIKKIRDGIISSLQSGLEWRMSPQRLEGSFTISTEESPMPTPTNLKKCVMNATRADKPHDLASCPGCHSRLIALARGADPRTLAPNIAHAGPMAGIFATSDGYAVALPLAAGIDGIAAFGRSLVALTDEIKARVERPVVPVSDKMLKGVAERNRATGYDVDIDG